MHTQFDVSGALFLLRSALDGNGYRQNVGVVTPAIVSTGNVPARHFKQETCTSSIISLPLVRPDYQLNW